MKGVKVDWLQIRDFSDYSVHFTGMVRNDITDKILAFQRNQHGVIYVGLVRDRHQYKRAVSLLVAEAFLPHGLPDTFDTPIHLDGDLSNNSVDNLMWRPRWFAIHYQRQFRRSLHLVGPIQDKHTGERFKNSMEVCTTYGLLHNDLCTAMLKETTVWPTYQEFRIVGG